MTEEPKPIEYLEPPRRAHSGEAEGGTIVIYRLKLMNAEEIEAHGLTHYLAAPKVGDGNGEQ